MPYLLVDVDDLVLRVAGVAGLFRFLFPVIRDCIKWVDVAGLNDWAFLH